MYPYFRFDGFNHTSEEREWKVVRLENPYIEVTVLPEVGGKVWGAIEKSTAEEFVYKNDVLKFRDIAVRGPWTSGGIEHNFSVYGHAPTTATPVNYLTKRNEDGSVSVIVGATDWSSRTKWRVTMTVPRNAAYLKLENLWFNPTPLNALRYHWLNAAVEARNDLQFYFPGDYYINHQGEAFPWPTDEAGRNLSYYRNNDFGGNKSYHVLGEYSDFYGGYWHDRGFGFGHWGRYSDTPGKKIWIWSLARSGAIWEDLLTDADGQYVEVQAGRKYNQTLDSRGTPFGQKFFPGYVADRWTETWFPVKETGGISDASRYGVLHVTRSGNALDVAVNALEPLKDSLKVTADRKPVYGEALSLKPMEVARRTVALPAGSSAVVVTVGGSELQYASDESANVLDRPVRRTFTPDRSSAEWLFRKAERHNKAQQYEEALRVYHQVLEREPTHTRALRRVAELYYRRAKYKKSLDFASRVLKINTYDPGANYIYGIAQRQTGDLVNAREALGWAARSLKYRSGAYTQIADIDLQEGDFERAEEHARRALGFNTYNLSAYRALAISYRKQGNREAAEDVLSQLLDIDPLNHFARFEHYLLVPTRDNLDAFTSLIRGEFPDETYLELAVQYANRGRIDEAVQVLREAPADPIVRYWLAYLTRNRSKAQSRMHLKKALSMSPRLVFPFRLETLPVLKWAVGQETDRQQTGWKTKYYLGTLYWSKNREKTALELFEACGDEPDFAPFYMARASLQKEREDEEPGTSIADDLQRAIQLDEREWRAWRALIAYHNERGAFREALQVSGSAYERFPGNYYISLEHAATLLKTKQYASAAGVLEKAHVLPYEGAQRGHDLFERAYVLLAIEKMKSGNYDEAIEHLERSRLWPEHLGVGKPFSPDLRLQDFLEAHAYEQLGNEPETRARLEAIADYTAEHLNDGGVGNYLGAVALRKLGQAAEAKDLLVEWEKAAGPEDSFVQWALSSFRGDNRSAQKIAKQLNVQNFDDGTYALLQAFLAIKN